jgi:hypothetical protein
MTRLTTFRRSQYACWALFVLALAGCAGAHAAKTHARAMKSTHSAPRAHAAPAIKEPKVLVGELMA